MNLLAFCLAFFFLCANQSQPPSETPPSSPLPESQENQSVAPPDNWAESFLAQDPLNGKATVTLDEIRGQLLDPSLQKTVLKRHFSKVDANLDDRISFLAELLESDSTVVQQQAALELQHLDALESVIAEKLLKFSTSEEISKKEAAIVGLRNLTIEESLLTERHWSLLVSSLASDEETVRDAARDQLRRQGARSIPLLLNALRDERTRLQREAARLISDILGSNLPDAQASPGASSKHTPAPIPMATESFPGATIAKAAKRVTKPSSVRSLDDAPSTLVRVYYGTNRERMEQAEKSIERPTLYAILFLVLIGCIVFLLGYADSGSSLVVRGLLSLLLLVAAGFTGLQLRSAVNQYWSVRTGVEYGQRRDRDVAMHYGICDVSIPKSHVVGALESPLLGPEDEAKHIVLQRTEEMEEKEFYDSVRSQLASLPLESHGCFVFIHGFNVSFADAARRTAQIHYDLQFSGVPIFFSWPSRASVHHYFSDRNEIEYSRYLIKQFLLDVASRVESQRIHVIAHSMGADATCRAIAELGESGKIFDQIVLAAPDIDRDVFRTQIVPRLSKVSNRTTLYCSQNDLALHLSKVFNDAPRAGDSSLGVLVTQGMDTIDASGIDTALLGHSYYGDCVPILEDLRMLMSGNLPPDQRRLKSWPFDEQLKYWTFPDLAPLSPNVPTDQETGMEHSTPPVSN
jgi:esterase/lipase superfamily enzyme